MLAFSLLYIGCAAFYHSAADRTWLSNQTRSPYFLKAARYLGWALFLLALAILVASWGWQRGLSAWFALLFLAGITSIFIAALWRRLHLSSAALIAVLAAANLVISRGGL